ncbi:MAG: sugar phosphate isomerase/epimerase [Opitutae bacterium]|nr:sugar phosphate isomerase/epimerase [Opitutae bacterium]
MSITLGARAHDFGKLPAEILAEKIAAKGLTCVQLALAKALDGINSETGSLSPGLAAHVREAFARRGVRIAVLGCYVNLVHPDLAERRSLLARFKEHLRFARDFGCSVVATETASLNADWSAHPDNGGEAAFRTACESVGELVAEAEKFGVFVAIEGVAHHVVSTPQRMRRLLDEIASPNLQVLFDPVNLLSPENLGVQDRVMQESFDLFGDRIVVTHVKDFRCEGGKLRPEIIGRGQLNYELLARLLRARKSYIDVLIEDTTAATIDESIVAVRRAFAC